MNEDSIFVPGGDEIIPIEVTTSPYPGFATDLQQPITAVMIKAAGESRIVDTLYPERIKHIPEMQRMGVKIESKDGVIRINQSTELTGQTVYADEIRAGAALLEVALMTNGTTVIEKAENILRGYDCVVKKMTNLSADVEIIDED